ncbi:serine hydrolase domain-containing protein [Roseivirga sp.]|uniref:serine hydrolase domain-containing protein n=1 Tax=Roseivirga sp. TaxID=1964215 RepID=UPI002B271775|nr:serine hydrolase domain-containing protein [Roseivirga sp.]
MKQLLLILSITTLLFSCSQDKNTAQLAPKDPNAYKASIDSLFNAYEKSGAFMGSIALSHKGEAIYTMAIGFDDIETKKKSDVNTKYRIGSVSKTYTSVLIFKAIEENKLTLEQTIESYFPAVENANDITVAQLLQHRSGIPNFTSDPIFFNYHTQYTSPEEMLALISALGSDFAPDSKGEYSNSNYFLLAQILEKVYKASYEMLLEEKIWTPLNLKNTYAAKAVSLTNNEAYSYDYNTEWVKLPETDMSITKGAGSIVSSPSEVNKFMEALFAGEIVSAQSLALMKTVEDEYGMGLARYKINDRQGFGHRGTLDGYKTTAIYFANEKLAITIASNATKDNNINEIFVEVLKLYLNDAPIEASEEEVKKFTGIYISPEDNDSLVFIQDKNVLVLVIKNEFKEPLVYKGNNRFVFEQLYVESRSHTFSSDGTQLTLEQGDYKGTYIKK